MLLLLRRELMMMLIYVAVFFAMPMPRFPRADYAAFFDAAIAYFAACRFHHH